MPHYNITFLLFPTCQFANIAKGDPIAFLNRDSKKNAIHLKIKWSDILCASINIECIYIRIHVSSILARKSIRQRRHCLNHRIY